MKDPKYARFLQECKTNPHFAHCSICKSDFSIANGGTYLINRHIEQIGHKRLLAFEDKEKSRSMREFITPSTLLTKLTAAELSLVYHGVHHGHSYLLFFPSRIIQQIKKTRFFSVPFDGSNKGNIKMFPFIINYFTIQLGITRSVLEVNEQPLETADHIVEALHDALQKNGIDIQQMTAIGADNTNITSQFENSNNSGNIFFLTGNCYSHILNNSVKTSHRHLLVNIELYLSQLYSHFSSSSKRVLALKEYFDLVEEDYMCPLQHIKIRWLNLFTSIDRLMKVYELLSSYFLNMNNDEYGEICPSIIKEFFLSNVAKCTLHFLHQVLFDIQMKNLELQRCSTSIADLNRIVTSLLKKLNDRLKQNYFEHQTRILLNSMHEDTQQELTSSFINYLSSIIKYINKYYDDHRVLAESVAIFEITEIDQVTFDQIESCVSILNLELDYDKLFEQMIDLQSTFKEDEAADNEDEQFLHKTSTTQHHQKIRPDQVWAYLIAKTITNCDEITKLVSYVYSISCSNAFAEGVFSHMKPSWTASRNSMLSKTVAAELKIRLNCKTKYDQFFKFIQNENEVIKIAQSSQKYSHKRKTSS
ncbi:unnamed protein product [Rotaria sp. Silwood2]|nr:unnamed protein product [Rotaria sp. Silwood2]